MAGKKGRSGRKPDWWKHEADRLIHEDKLLQRLADFASGKPICTVTTISGEKVKVPASASAQIYASEKLMDRAWGKATQPLVHSGEIGTYDVEIFEVPTVTVNGHNGHNGNGHLNGNGHRHE